MDWPPVVPRGFPLTVTQRGYVKTIAGKTRWICGRMPPDEALRIYHRKANAILGKQDPLPEAPARRRRNPSLHEILSRWIRDLRDAAERGELRGSTWVQYRLSAKRISAIAGHYLASDINPDVTKALYDRLVKAHGVDWAKRGIGHFRAACNHAVDSGWCPPIRLGKRITARLASRPPAKMRWRLYTPAEVRMILAASLRGIRIANGRARPARIQLHAMILLALNGGYGSQELSDLPRSVVDLDHARIDYSRGKTGADHIVPLWPETVRALGWAMSLRPGDDLLFRTREGNPWCTDKHVYRNGKLFKTTKTDNVNELFTELVKPLGLKFPGQGFYKLKHLHATIADRAGDPHATFALAGHELPGSKSHYVHVGEDRLRRVVEFVREHLLLNRPVRVASRRRQTS